MLPDHHNRPVVIWSAPPLLDLILASPVAAHPRVRVLSSEPDFLASAPDRREVAALLVGQFAASAATLEVRALIAGRPGGWPPVVVFGPDREVLHGLDLAANSTVVVPLDPGLLAQRLLKVVDYWTNVNEANVVA